MSNDLNAKTLKAANAEMTTLFGVVETRTHEENDCGTVHKLVLFYKHKTNIHVGTWSRTEKRGWYFPKHIKRTGTKAKATNMKQTKVTESHYLVTINAKHVGLSIRFNRWSTTMSMPNGTSQTLANAVAKSVKAIDDAFNGKTKLGVGTLGELAKRIATQLDKCSTLNDVPKRLTVKSVSTGTGETTMKTKSTTKSTKSTKKSSSNAKSAKVTIAFPTGAFSKCTFTVTNDGAHTATAWIDTQRKGADKLSKDGMPHKTTHVMTGGWVLGLWNVIARLSRARKSREADHAVLIAINEHPKNNPCLPEIPDYAEDMHTLQGKRKGRGWGHFLTEGSALVHGDQHDGHAWEGDRYVDKCLEVLCKKHELNVQDVRDGNLRAVEDAVDAHAERLKNGDE